MAVKHRLSMRGRIAVVAVALTAWPSGSRRSRRSPWLARAPPRRCSWTPCRDGFQCATVQVPLDYDRPAGTKISLSLIRLPASSPQRRIGSLLVNPGGPGGSGVDFARGIAKFLPLELRAGSTSSASIPGGSPGPPRCAASTPSTRRWRSCRRSPSR